MDTLAADINTTTVQCTDTIFGTTGSGVAGGSDRRARLKSAARRAEGAVTSSRQGRRTWVAAEKRHRETLRALDDANANDADAAEKQRLRFEAHEIEAEASGSRRKWDSVRQKASGAMTALEAELRAIGHM